MTAKNTVILNGKEYNINERLPDSFLKKDYQGSHFIEIAVVRDILRQMGVLQSITFGNMTTIAEGQKGNTYTQKCTIKLLDGTILEGDGYMNITHKKMLGTAVFGVFSNLKSRAVKTALTFYKKIFELPIEDEEELNEQIAEVAEKKGDTPKQQIVQEIDLVEKFIEFIGSKEPKTVEEFETYKKEFNKKYLKQIKALPKTELEKLKQLSKEYADNFKS